jgi:ATP-dependent protease HslVU (ClpYQ) ATPase subunit
MAYRHVRRVKRIYLDGAKREQLLPKSNTLLVGPTGCGKTHLVELLFQQILRLPTVIIDLTTYSETGYVGQDPSTILTRLLHAADDNPLLASIGIVCLDEFDKIASGQNNAIFAGAGTTKDVTGLGVQRELLKLREVSTRWPAGGAAPTRSGSGARLRRAAPPTASPSASPPRRWSTWPTSRPTASCPSCWRASLASSPSPPWTEAR